MYIKLRDLLSPLCTIYEKKIQIWTGNALHMAQHWKKVEREGVPL